jgi:exosome complex component RRP4
MDDIKRKYVIPGDVITTGPYRAEENVNLVGDRIIATTVGISEIYDSGVRVIPLTGMYLPRIDDFIIGLICARVILVYCLPKMFLAGTLIQKSTN